MPGRVQPEVLPSFIPAHPQLSKKRFYQCFSSFFFDVDLVSSKRSKKNSFVVTILFIKNSFLIEIHVGTHSKSIWKKYYFYWQCSFLKLYSIRYYWKKEKEKNRLKFRKIEEYIYILSFHCCENDSVYSDLAVGHRPTVSRNRYETRECANTPS